MNVYLKKKSSCQTVVAHQDSHGYTERPCLKQGRNRYAYWFPKFRQISAAGTPHTLTKKKIPLSPLNHLSKFQIPKLFKAHALTSYTMVTTPDSPVEALHSCHFTVLHKELLCSSKVLSCKGCQIFHSSTVSLFHISLKLLRLPPLAFSVPSQSPHHSTFVICVCVCVHARSVFSELCDLLKETLIK